MTPNNPTLETLLKSLNQYLVTTTKLASLKLNDEGFDKLVDKSDSLHKQCKTLIEELNATPT